MNIALSQRAGRAMSTDVYRDLSREQRQSFLEAVEQAKDFDALDSVNKKVLVDAEKTYLKGSSKV